MGFEFGDIPQECFSFCLTQYERFRVPMPDELAEVVTSGASATLYFMDCIDPYVLFSGISDVELTDEWSECAYEIIDGNRVYEADPTSIETFRFVPGRDEEEFNYIMSRPGLKALPNMLGPGISDVLEGEWGSDCYYLLSTDTTALLNHMCLRADGSVNREMRDAYLELAAWAACGWLVGPLARAYRHAYHDVCNVAMDYGEAVLLDGTVLNPKSYRKLPRAPRSCMVCGLSSWCVELTSSVSGTRHMCEHCLSEGMPPSPLSTCGSKRCLLAACRHHPYHHLGSAGVHEARKDFGQLGASARGESALRIRGGRSQPPLVLTP